MTLLNSADLVYLRAEAELLLSDLCDIYERQITNDGTGGFTETWNLAYADVMCRISEAQRMKGEGVQGDRESADNDWILTVPYDQAITRDDRVIHNAHTYEIAFVNTDRSHDTTRRVQLRRID